MRTLLVLIATLALIYFGITLNVPIWAVVLALIAVPAIFGIALAVIQVFPLAAEASARGVDVNLPTLVRWRLTGVDPRVVVSALLRLDEEALEVEPRTLARLSKEGVAIEDVVPALIALTRRRLPVSLEEIAAMNLAGADVVAAAERMVQADDHGEEMTFEQACTETLPAGFGDSPAPPVEGEPPATADKGRLI